MIPCTFIKRKKECYSEVGLIKSKINLTCKVDVTRSMLGAVTRKVTEQIKEVDSTRYMPDETNQKL